MYKVEKAHYEDQEENMQNLYSNQTMIFVLITIIIIMVIVLYWFFMKWTREESTNQITNMEELSVERIEVEPSIGTRL